MTGPLHIALTFDDRYWAPAYAVMRSICLASNRRPDLVFHLIHTGIGPANRAQLDSLASEFPVAINHIALDQHQAYKAFVADLPIAKPFSPVIYARLLLDRLLPETAQRIVYLDCDTLVRAPIETLFAENLEGKPIGAVLDAHRHMQMLGRDLRQNGDVFSYNFPYFNSGVLLIDRSAYARADMPARTMELHRTGLLGRLQYDQAALNLVFKDNWHSLDRRWNVICPEPAHEVLDPFILHYTGPRKPWSLLPGAAFARLYRHVMTNDIYYAFWRERVRGRLPGLLKGLVPK